ncbi:MAG: PQQ-dependent sugar dehydrogenase [Ginsengibacter sp.]
MMKFCTRRIFTILLFFITSLQTKAQKLALVPYASGINLPIDLENCGDNRMFVPGLDGIIHIINADGTLRPTPFLNISSKISIGTEDGLLGMAFSPNYKTDRKFYLYYIASIAGVKTTVVEEYKVSVADSNVANLSSALTLITLSQPFDTNVGGNLMFGMDGYLYINIGDGATTGDPNGNGQNKNTLHGKILRIDINNSSAAQPYAIPATNPFYNDPTPGIKKEIWAYGVRNPWRASIDRLTGDLWIADVGDNLHEEVDYQPKNAAGGRNYGWNIMEGNSCYNPPIGCSTVGITLPLYDYPHTYGFAVIGGYVYRSAQSKALFGTYLLGDYAAKWIDGIKQSGGILSGSVTHFITNSQAIGNPICFGEDMYGDQYILLNGNGTVFKLQDTSYLRRPKAYFTPVDQGDGTFLFQGLEGTNLTYQWLKNNAVIPGATSPDYITSAPATYALVVTNTLNFSDTSDAFSLGPLPLKLTSFTAQKIAANKIRLVWKTASEQDVSGYTILRRQNNEINFSNIGFVESKSLNGNSNKELDYTFTDSSALSNSNLFYRLQIQKKDGSYTYSDIRTITSGANSNSFTFSPNPAKGQVQINLDTFIKPAVIILYDVTGKKVKEQSLNQQSTTIELSGLKGIYIVQLSDKDGGNLIRRKLVVQ